MQDQTKKTYRYVARKLHRMAKEADQHAAEPRLEGMGPVFDWAANAAQLRELAGLYAEAGK